MRLRWPTDLLSSPSNGHVCLVRITEVILWHSTWFPLKKMKSTYGSIKGQKEIPLFFFFFPNTQHLFSRENGALFLKKPPPSLPSTLLPQSLGAAVGIMEYEIWRVLVRQFALGMLSVAPIPSQLLCGMLCILDQSILPPSSPEVSHSKTCMSLWAWNAPLEAFGLYPRWWNI